MHISLIVTRNRKEKKNINKYVEQVHGNSLLAEKRRNNRLANRHSKTEKSEEKNEIY